jgi:hypothetical protein
MLDTALKQHYAAPGNRNAKYIDPESRQILSQYLKGKTQGGYEKGCHGWDQKGHICTKRMPADKQRQEKTNNRPEHSLQAISLPEKMISQDAPQTYCGRLPSGDSAA